MFRQRRAEKELLDLGPDFYSHEEYNDCMHKLFQLNKILGIFKDTVALLKKLPESATILDIGCGSGLFLLHLNRIYPKMKLVGVDIADDAIRLAKNLHKKWQSESLVNNNVNFLLENIPLNFAEKSVDVILATLVCHHLSEDELIFFLHRTQMIARKMVILNDLHRHRFSYWGYAIICPLLFHNRLIQHDGLISICRGFILSEWRFLFEKAGIRNYQIKWRFPFRWQIIITPRE